MREPAPFEVTAKSTVVLRIIWVSMLMTQVLVHVLFWFTRSERGVAISDLLPFILAATGTALPLIAGFVARLIVAAGGGTAEAEAHHPLARVFPAIIVNLALRESGGILAAVALMLGADPVLWAVPAAVAFGATLVAYPSVTAVERFLAMGTATRRFG